MNTGNHGTEMRLTVRVPQDIADKLREMSREHDRSFNGEIVFALRDYVRRAQRRKKA